MADFYSKPVHQRLSQRIFEGLISTAAVYLLSPQLLSFLAPFQAQLNASALNNGQTPPSAGVNAVANTLITPTPPGTPAPTAPADTTTTIIPANPITPNAGT